ncbi:outer membrane beta-barrel protein [Treponema succinifaciens]|uniref:outer membrane beta-barrel protein n=1 Tax=Treponema succinifaciens TaxID=167 RepID=UPI002A7F8D54|nr:outer membrane beta-barrel protein [Treponema succinifaciens]MDY5117651.1 outer membrane beta-barrel protein [Treponema succinifaciens]
MKKTLIAVAAAAALTATSAFAEITFGAWLRSITGVASNGEDIVTGTSNSWGGMRPSRLNVAGTSEDGNAGFKLDMYYNTGDNIQVGDNAYIWVKPASSVQLALGKFDGGETGLRGDLCYGSWAWLRPGNWIAEDEGLTFNGSHTNGLMAKITPVDGLVAVIQLPVYNDKWGGNNDSYVAKTATEDAKNTIEDTFKNGMYAAAYTIEGLGTLKAGYFGSYAEHKKGETTREYLLANGQEDGKWVLKSDSSAEPEWKYNSDTYTKDSKQIGTVNVAFDFNAVENLFVTVGARFGIADKEYKADNEKIKFTAGASYQVSDAMKFTVSGGYVQYQDKCVGKASDKKDNAFSVGAGVDYAIMDGLNAAADLRYKNIGYGKDKDEGAISFLVGVTKNVSSNGYIGVGFQGATNGNGLTGIGANKNDDFVWAVPVALSVWF